MSDGAPMFENEAAIVVTAQTTLKKDWSPMAELFGGTFAFCPDCGHPAEEHRPVFVLVGKAQRRTTTCIWCDFGEDPCATARAYAMERSDWLPLEERT